MENSNLILEKDINNINLEKIYYKISLIIGIPFYFLISYIHSILYGPIIDGSTTYF